MKTSLNQPVRIVLLLTVIATLQACQMPGGNVAFEEFAPSEDQGLRREANSFTIGVPLTNPYNLPSQVAYRPSASFEIGTTHAAMEDSTYYDLQTLPNGMMSKGSHKYSEVYLRYFPAQRSGFYVGLGADRQWGEVSIYDRPEQGASIDENSPVFKAKYDAIYAGPSYGFVWQWDNGLTFGFDISKRKRFKHNFTYTFQTRRSDETVEQEAVKRYIPSESSGTFTLGYSF